MKIQIRGNRKLSTTLLRKPNDCAAFLHFQSNHSLKCKESIVYSQALRYITHNISKTIRHPRDTLLREPTKASDPTAVLTIITPYSVEGKSFSQSVRDKWHIIENDPQLHSIWPNPPITAYHKTESLKDILVHSRQAKPTYLCQNTTPKQNH